MNHKDDSDALRSATPTAVAAALGLQVDEQKQREKGGQSVHYFRAGTGELVLCLARPREAAAPLWRVGDQKWTDAIGAAQILTQAQTIGHAKANLRRGLGLIQNGQAADAHAKKNAQGCPVLGDPKPAPLHLVDAPRWGLTWLIQTRGIRLGVVEHYKKLGLIAGVERETKSGGKFVNLAFPYVTSAGDLVGAEIRGMPPGDAGKRQFRAFEGARTDSFFMMPPTNFDQAAKVVVVVESAIDALAFACWSIEQRKAPAFILATGGMPTSRQPAAAIAFMQDIGADLMVCSQDNDKDGAGDKQAEKFMDAAKSSKVEAKRLRPPGVKDWGEWAQKQKQATKP